MDRLSYRQWIDSESSLAGGVVRSKIAFYPFFINAVKRTVASGFWICTVVVLATQLISRIPLPNDGQVVEIQPSRLFNKPKLNHLRTYCGNS